MSEQNPPCVKIGHFRRSPRSARAYRGPWPPSSNAEAVNVPASRSLVNRPETEPPRHKVIKGIARYFLMARCEIILAGLQVSLTRTLCHQGHSFRPPPSTGAVRGIGVNLAGSHRGTTRSPVLQRGLGAYALTWDLRTGFSVRHSGVRRNPGSAKGACTPAFAGVTMQQAVRSSGNHESPR